MRILQVINSTIPEGGGPIEAIRQAHRALLPLGHQTEIACLDPPDAPWLRELELPTHGLGPAISAYRYARRFAPWLRAHGREYDCAIVNGIWLYPSYGTWRVLHKLGVPYYVYTHGMLDPAHKQVFPFRHLKKLMVWKTVERRVLRDARAVFFTCEEERELARQSFQPYACEHNAVILPYCVGAPPDDGPRQRSAFFAAFPQLQGRRLILFLSRVHPKKGCDLVIDAFATAAQRDDSLHLVMAGSGPQSYRARLEAQIRRLGIEPRVTWTGMLSGERKWGAFRCAELFVLPSHQENFGIAVVEALACQLPVLISNRINIWREVAAAQAGLICDDTSHSTTEVLQKWLDLTSDQRRQMRRDASACFTGNFSAEKAVRLLLDNLNR